ncbi:MAG: hypothetical protein QXX94_00570 [Candidatus Bathyarchaeia archaeon]
MRGLVRVLTRCLVGWMLDFLGLSGRWKKITLDIEDEAKAVIEYRFREMGYEIKVGPLILTEVELNIYGGFR